MVGLRLAISSAIIFLGATLASCDKIESICGHSEDSNGPPDCCAYPSAKPTNFECKSTDGDCASLAKGSHTFPYRPTYSGDSQANAGCSIKWKKWPFSVLSAASAFSTARVFAKQDEPLDCRAACDYDNGKGNGNAGDCPGLGLRPSVVASLFTFYSSVDPSSYNDDTTLVPVKSILSSFDVPPERLNKCLRADVVIHKDGLVQNVGASCGSSVSFTSATGASPIQGLLVIGELLSGRVTQSAPAIRWMEYDGQNSTFSIKFPDDPQNDKFFAGYIARSGMLREHPIAEVVTPSNGKFCVRGDAQAATAAPDVDVSKNNDEATLQKAMQAYVSAISSHYDSTGQDRAPYPGLADAFDKLDTSQKNSLLAEITKIVNPKDKVDVIYIRSLADSMDAGLCNQMLYKDGKIDLDFLRAYNSRFMNGKSDEQRDQAGERLLHCAFSSNYLSSRFSDALSKIIKR